MIQQFSDIPEVERAFLIQRYLGQWRGKVAPEEHEAAEAHVRKEFIYLLRMFWQARFDKMDSESIEVFDYLSKNMLPADAKYKGPVRGENLVDTSRFYQLSDDLFKNLWSCYKQDPESGLVSEEKKSIMERLTSVFRF